nr:DKNYY domain-containing protein [uncultured Capnocytophaga sp.]
MKHLISLLLLYYLQNLSAQTEPLKVTDAIKVNNLNIEQNWNSGCRYVEGYILNKDYLVYQTCDTRKVLKADMSSFQIQREESFAIDKNGIYYQGVFFPIDTAGFKIVGIKERPRGEGDIYKGNEYLWRTNKKAFLGTKEINISHPASFEAVEYFNGCYFKDKNYLYYYDKKIKDSDATSVRTNNHLELISDKNNTYHRGVPITYKGEGIQNINNNLFKTSKYVLYSPSFAVGGTIRWIELSNIDAKTLHSLSRNYAMDKNHIFYERGKVTPIKKQDFNNIRIFDQVNSCYISDGKIVYAGENYKTNYDAPTFGMLPKSDFKYDKNGIYYKGNEKMPFHYTDVPVLGKNTFYNFDKGAYVIYNQQAFYPFGNNDYYPNLNEQQINDLKEGNIHLALTSNNKSAKIQEVFEYNLYKANNTIYIGKVAQNVDVATFQNIGNYSFYKDKNNVYYYDRWGDDPKLLVITGYDTATLAATTNGFFADKNFWYYRTIKLFKNESVELLAIYSGYRKGCGFDKNPSTNYYLFKNSEGYWLTELGGENTIQFLGSKLNNFNL